MNSILSSIMQSIHSFHCENIAIGRKGFEVRKTKPNISTPFKAYIYETKFINHCRDCEFHSFENIVMGRMKDVCKYEVDKWKITSPSSRCFQNKYSGGKVIGEYICDEIQEWKFDNETNSYDISDDDLALTCLTQEQLWEYGKGKTLYGYHITDLKIYDEPKELSKFYKPCPCNNKCYECKYHFDGYFVGNIPIPDECGWFEGGDGALTRPPQSWFYVEEV